jgi:hypothetical protein
MKHPLSVNLHSGLRRLLLATLVAALIPVSAAAAAGPNVTVQVNGIEGKIARGSVQLGAASDPPVHGTGLSQLECPSLTPGDVPADSIAAALLALSSGWSITSSYGKLDFAGNEYPMESLASRSPGTGWQLWVNERYIDLGLVSATAFCDPLQDGQTVVLQGSELITESGPFFEPATPHIQIENVPETVAVGQPFSVTVAAYQPASWGGSDLGQRTAGPGYSVSLNGGAPAATNANGQATLTATAEETGEVFLIARAGEDPNFTLPTPAGNSALSLPASVCVYDETPQSPCVASELSAEGTDFGTQALDTLAAPQAIVLTPSLGTAQVTKVRVSGTDADDFIISSDGCTGTTVNSGIPTTCTVRVRFAPSQAGPRDATLLVASNAMNGTLEVPLTGAGGALPTGARGEAGAQGLAGPAGPSVQGPQGSAGASGSPGAAGVKGVTGRRGPAGRDAVCKVKREKGAPRITCALKVPGARATLTREGRTYARGTIASLRATRAVPVGHYTLRYRTGGHEFALAITLR